MWLNHKFGTKLVQFNCDMPIGTVIVVKMPNRSPCQRRSVPFRRNHFFPIENQTYKMPVENQTTTITETMQDTEFFKKRNIIKSDPISILNCDCKRMGSILLFYNHVPIPNLIELAKDLKLLSLKLDLNGKIRVSKQGYNITVGGELINEFQEYFITRDYLLPGVDKLSRLELNEFKMLFFKPSRGCKHGNSLLISL